MSRQRLGQACQSHVQGSEAMACLQRISQSPANDLAGIQIRDERQIANAFLCFNVGYIHGPSFVRTMELKILYGIGIPSVWMVGVGCFVPFAAPKFQ